MVNAFYVRDVFGDNPNLETVVRQANKQREDALILAGNFIGTPFYDKEQGFLQHQRDHYITVKNIINGL